MTASYKPLRTDDVELVNQRSTVLRTVLLLMIVSFLLFCLLGYYYQPEVGDRAENQYHMQDMASHEALLRRLKTILNCHTPTNEYRLEPHGSYYLLRNFIAAEQPVECYETITYTTHGDYSFLDNVVPLLERWQAPVSVALYSPGTDLDRTVERLRLLRDCDDHRQIVRRYVSFHLYLDFEHLPPHPIAHYQELVKQPIECPVGVAVIQDRSYRAEHNLTYPVNVGRNVARTLALTHFVLASDIELYPSPDFIPMFLRMVAHPFYQYTLHGTPSVYVLPVFELTAASAVLDGLPQNKAQLLAALASGGAIKFHEQICPHCHTVPGYEEWLGVLKDEYTMDILTTAKRDGPFALWEPFYVGTNRDPKYDERLTWEGKADKMTQAYIMCILGYDYHVLDNAFLVHRPGIKTLAEATNPAQQTIQRSFIRSTILNEITSLYGQREGCKI
ncbi:N-acetyl lactosaminide beta-1,3-N-acetyl glucosaminyl transferase [Anopheles darlingi]|uniref:N-acetyl lactosaminide beta-1,3-N-acetyl glucosaminyl transferase n=1 Tax=Anopheles darlingi TaxID=43151 RepID=W5J4G3_ANODA|nr:N-acetyl lactosaminide beta-1,3-N-acetyl glucosaminyl transferase [Anopheles darlingi]